MTAYEPSGEGDEADGTPRDPVGPRKREAGKPTPDQPASATRQGNKDKFAWLYAMMADPTVSIAAKVVGAGCAMKMAGSKGHFKATRKAVANLCGISQATVRRGLADLIDKRFLDVDLVEGAANTYHLIFPAQRCQEWWKAEWEYEQETARADAQISDWLYAEKKWRDNQMETQFRAAIFEASIARGADAGRATWIAERIVVIYRERGLELNTEWGLATIAKWTDEVFTPAEPAAESPPSGAPESDQKRAGVGTPESRPRLNVEPTPVRHRADPGTPESRPRLIPRATSSEDDQTRKSLKDPERPVKVFQDSESETALRDALTRALRPVRSGAGECELCGPDGLFLDPDGYPVVLTDDGADWTEYAVECRHSMAGNLAEIQRREKVENLALCKTGWPDIDSHYPNLRD
ncbi:MAG: hypothetical protein ACOYB7_02495 [Mycobacterium sp.]